MSTDDPRPDPSDPAAEPLDGPERAVAAAVGDASTVPRPPEGAREQAIAAALAVFDEEVAPSAGGAEVVDLASRRRLPAWLGAAAAVLAVVAVAGGVVSTFGDEDADSGATVAADESGDGEADVESASEMVAEDAGADADMADEQAESAGGGLAEFAVRLDGPAEVEDYLASRGGEEEAGGPPAPTSATRSSDQGTCDTVEVADLDGPVDLLVEIIYDDRPAELVATVDEYAVVDIEACAVRLAGDRPAG